MIDRSLRAFLYKQRIGELDSEGEFTLDPRQAMEKMGRYQLESPDLWMVKVAQAGVRLGAQEISFTLDRRAAIVRFFDSPSLDGRELRLSLLSGELPSEAWKHHMVVGLRALLAQEPRSLSWTDSAGRLTTVGEEPARPSEPEAGDKGASWVLRVEAGQPGGWMRKLSWRPFPATPLSRHLPLCAVPIRVNGNVVSRQFPPPAPGLRGLISEAVVMVVEGFGNTLPLVVANHARINLALSTVPKCRAEPYRVGAVAVLTESSRPSYCFWVKDGALLRPRPLVFDCRSKTATRYSLNVYLDGSDIEVDLSEFTPRRTGLDLLKLQVALRSLVGKMDLTARVRRRIGWTLPEQASEDRRALVEAIDWIRFQ